MENRHLWKNDEKRQTLKSICSYASPFPIRKFNAFWETFEKEHPDWFQTEEGKLKEPVTKEDFEKLTSRMGDKFGHLTAQLNAIDSRLVVVWWFSLGALIGVISVHL